MSTAPIDLSARPRARRRSSHAEQPETLFLEDARPVTRREVFLALTRGAVGLAVMAGLAFAVVQAREYAVATMALDVQRQSLEFVSSQADEVRAGCSVAMALGATDARPGASWHTVRSFCEVEQATGWRTEVVTTGRAGELRGFE